jgi:hypothetical protein
MASLDQASGHTHRLAGLLMCDYAVYRPRLRRLHRLFGRSSRWNSHWRWQLFTAFPKPLKALISGLNRLWLLAPTVFTVVFVERVEARSSVIDWGVIKLVVVSVSLVPGSAEVNMKMICRRNR